MASKLAGRSNLENQRSDYKELFDWTVRAVTCTRSKNQRSAMENAGDVDQFASLIIPNCKTTSSQEEKLQYCPFARESEVFSGGAQSSSSPDEASEQATGIIMVSLPDSSEDYQTPPEQHSHSQNSSNDGQVPATKAAAVDREMESGGVGEGQAMMVDDGCEGEGQRMVDLTNDSDNLGFSEKIPRVLEDDDPPMVGDNDTDQIEAAFGVSGIEAEHWITEALKTESISSPKESTHKVSVEMPLREQEVSTRGKRKLPLSVNGQEKNSGKEADYARHEALKNALSHALKILAGEVKGSGRRDENDGDIDFLETAKRPGLTFPRPRWWPPEGFEG